MMGSSGRLTPRSKSTHINSESSAGLTSSSLTGSRSTNEEYKRSITEPTVNIISPRTSPVSEERRARYHQKKATSRIFFSTSTSASASTSDTPLSPRSPRPSTRSATIHAESTQTMLEAFKQICSCQYPLVLSSTENLGFVLKQLTIFMTFILSAPIDTSQEFHSSAILKKDKMHERFINYMQAVQDFQASVDLLSSVIACQKFILENSKLIQSFLEQNPEQEEDYLSLWDEDSGLCGLKQPREGDFVSWDSELWIDVEIQDIIKSMNNVAFMVKHASLNHLIILLTHSNYYDPHFLKIFFSTYLSFTTPEILFKKLYFRYAVPALSDVLGKTIKIRVINAIKSWMNTRFEDFDETMVFRVQRLLDHLQQEQNPAHSSLLNSFSRCISVNRDVVVLQPTKEESHEQIERKKIFKRSSEEIAQVLSLVEFDLWIKLKPSDLISTKNMNSISAVMNLISHFNSVSQWACSSILEQDKLSGRAKVLTKIIEIAIELFKLNNFNVLFALSCGICNASVMRLKWTFAEVPEKLQNEWDKIGELLQSAHNYSAYRTHIRTRNPPLIPFLGQYLTDLTMIKDGNPNLNPAGLINFHKRQLLYKVISEIELSQLTPYSFKNYRPLYNFYSNLPAHQEEAEWNDQLYALSLAREPRNVQSKKQLP